MQALKDFGPIVYDLGQNFLHNNQIKVKHNQGRSTKKTRNPKNPKFSNSLIIVVFLPAHSSTFYNISGFIYFIFLFTDYKIF